MSFRDVGRSHLASKKMATANRMEEEYHDVVEDAKFVPRVHRVNALTPRAATGTAPRTYRDSQRQQAESPIDQIALALKMHDREINYRVERKLMQQSTTVPRYDIAKSIRMSAFSRLNDEIMQFHRLVHDLELIMQKDLMTPEEQWRARIILKSAAESDEDLLAEIRDSPWNKQKGLAVKVSFSKLKRDFERVHSSYEEVLEQYHAKQRAEAALLSSQIEERVSSPRRSLRQVSLVLEEEDDDDFFDRAIREREEETKQINSDMHKVNGIYEELSKIVNDQQEKVNYLEDSFRLSRAHVEVGVENFQQSRRGILSCASDPDLYRPRMCGDLLPDPGSPRSIIMRRSSSFRFPSEEIFDWKMPFKTFGPNIVEVGTDLLDLGHIGAKKLRKARRKTREAFRCGQVPDDEYNEYSIFSETIYSE